MRFLFWIPAMLLLSGCTMDGDDDGADGADGGAGTANIDSVTVTDFPESGEPGETVEICWEVQGSGEIPHTAVHWDTESHAGADAAFSDYEGGAAYPGGAASAEQLPGDFCANMDLPDEEGTVYFRAHAMIDAPGIVSSEHEILVDDGLPLT